MPLVHRRALIPSLLLGAVVLAGCATTTETVVTDLSSAGGVHDPYIGMHKDKIMELWGKPTAMQPDGKGGTILVYDRRKVLEWREMNARDRATDPDDSQRWVHHSGEKSTTVLSQEWAKFSISAEGFVYQTWFHPDLWKDGVPEPPPKEKTKKQTEKQAGPPD